MNAETIKELRRVIDGLDENSNHDNVYKQILSQLVEKMYNSKFPDKPVEGDFKLEVNFGGSSICRLKGEVKANG